MVKETPTVLCPACGKQIPLTPADLVAEVVCFHCGERFIPTAPMNPREREIAHLAVRLKLLTADQPESITKFPASTETESGARFVAAGLLSEAQLARLLTTLQFKDKRVADSRFGNLAIERGWATQTDIADALETQKAAFLRDGTTKLIGALLVEQQVLSSEQCEMLLAEQGRTRSQPQKTPKDEGDVANIRVIVASDHMSAMVKLEGTATPPSAAQLREELAHSRVTHGIDNATLNAIAEGKLDATEGVVVANATPPVAPVDGYVEYLFDRHPLKAGREKGEGQMDFRDRGEIPQVATGSVLARHIPPRPGQPGIDVFGRSTLSARAKDTPLRAGKGVALDSEKLNAVATEDGFPSVSPTGVLSVFPEYRVEGDVDFSTGHINFHGRVVVEGAVRARFRVRCGELVAKEIEAAIIDTDGDVTVNGGVIGAQIRCGGTLRAFYLHRTKAEVMGDAIIVREVVETELEAGGAFSGKNCVILSSSISAMGQVEAKAIGSESSNPCRIVSGIDEKVQHELALQQQQIEAQRNTCEELEKCIAEKSARRDATSVEIGPLAQEQDRAQVRQRQLQKEKGDAAAKELAEIADQVRMVEEKLNALFAEQDHLEAELRADQEASLIARETLLSQESELAHLKEWAAGRVGNFLLRAELVHQQTVLKGPHLEARLENDRKAAKIVERERVSQDGQSSWSFVSI